MAPEMVNALAKASSAYLRSAMHQPIQWHEWGEEAFAIARRDNKPILLDIGAVWCHWCHVMDRESYDSPEIAQIVNERFVAVKVDRDERPDIDSRYQVAVQAVSGQGGWPLTAFLTPDGKPFYGGTYFPPNDQYGRPSFRRVLLAISDAYREKNGDVTDQARMVENAIAHSEAHSGSHGEFSPGIVDAIVQAAVKMFDSTNGGFGHAPKFAHPGVLDLLMDQYAKSRDESLRRIFETTLERMARGGVYDQLAGGFHRYSVDERWVVPHFEKMCYDNSELLKNYVHAYQVTGSQFYADVARDIIRWMDEWLSDREQGGFYASQDADYSMDDDGDYFTWTVEETKTVLSEQEAQAVCLHFDINEIGEMHHNPAKNVLFQRAGTEETAKRMGLPARAVNDLLESAKAKMYAARLKRPTPYVDKTVYTGWNAMCVSAYLEAARVLELDSAKHFALRSLDRILAEGWQDDRLQHVIAYSDPNAPKRHSTGMLDDYAFTAIACLDAYEATADLSYFHFAQRLVTTMVELFHDPTGGGFFDSQATAGQSLGVLGTRRKPFQDSPTPAGNSVAAIALLRLHALRDENHYREKAEQTLEVIAGVAGQYGIFAATYGIAAVHLAHPPAHLVVVGDDDKLAHDLLAIGMRSFRLEQTIMRVSTSHAVPQNLPPALAATIPQLPLLREGKTAAVLCSGMACQPPIDDPAELAHRLGLLR